MTPEIDLRDTRRDYQGTGIRRADMHSDPVQQFATWLQDVVDANAIDATSMTLATASKAAIPSARIVLLKHFDRHGFCWYTDSRSQKGQQLAENPNAALVFHWRDLNRQVRIVGTVEKLGTEDADNYYYSRPQGSRFSAAASHQTSTIDNREQLEQCVESLHTQYPDGDVPRPNAWIGYRLIPDEFEFWQGKSNRLHDRIIYQPTKQGWMLLRRSP